MTLARRRWAPLVLAGGALFACAPKPPPAPPKPAVVEAPPPPPPPVVQYRRRIPPHPERKPAPPEEVAAAEATPASATPAEAVPAAVAPVVPPAMAPPPPAAEVPAEGRLIGLDQKAAMHLFGAAAERAEKAPATVWRYKGQGCELDLYFYLDLKSGHMRTLHYAFKGAAQDATQRQECLRGIVDQSRQPGSPHAASAAR